ncbi:MAG: hypothetical protein Q7S45_01180 [Candidatus Curtissbacteria bacterium]|nr:hypothetical protein [Candidatus Curtissbacteria bacterium]
MGKLIVTHNSPDLDGIPAIWLLRKFHPDFKNARIAFVPAGTTYNNQAVDSDPDIVHVDTGMGRFDHHQTNDFTCGAQLVYEWLVREGYISADDKAISRMIEVITELDHAYDAYKWPEPASDRWEFSLHNVLTGWKMMYGREDDRYVGLTIEGLEAVYRVMQQKVKAEEEVSGGEKFKTRWGNGVAIYTSNDSVLDAAIKGGYAVVVRKDPGKGYIRITGSNAHSADLTRAYEDFQKADPDATWFLHASKKLLRNGSTRNPTMRPTKLELDQVIKILERA